MKTTASHPTTFETVNEVRQANKSIGNHWFSKQSMSFFRTHVTGGDKLINKRYFITSEQFVSSQGVADPRKYTIRIALPNGQVDTIGEFQAYATKKEAIKAAHKLVD